MLKNYRIFLNEKKVELQLAEQEKKQYISKLKKLQKEEDTLHSTREVFQKASLLTQNYLAEHLSSIVTKTLRTVFYEKDISFHVEFIERRNTTECDMWIQEGKYKYGLFTSKGGGVIDIVSFSLKIAYIILCNCDNVLIIDEPFRNLDVTKHEIASQMIKGLSDELGIQFIISTHVPALKEYADKEFHITQINGVSYNN